MSKIVESTPAPVTMTLTEYRDLILKAAKWDRLMAHLQTETQTA